MPENDFITTIRDCLESSLAYSMDVTEEVVFEGEYREALGALESLALEAVEHPWTGNGPTVEEAGGESILVRVGEDLVRGRWGFPCRPPAGAAAPWSPKGGWCDDEGCQWTAKHPPTGWRRMPRLTTTNG